MPRVRRARSRGRRTPARAPTSTRGARRSHRRRGGARWPHRSAARSARSRAARMHRSHRSRGASGTRSCAGRRLDLLLVEQDLERVPLVRHLPGECLVEHHADAVPVRGRADLAAAGLLGRHVLDRADRAVRDRLPRGLERRHEAEVEDHDAAIGRDQHVRRLDVAVDEPAGVQRTQPDHELAEPARAAARDRRARAR